MKRKLKLILSIFFFTVLNAKAQDDSVSYYQDINFRKYHINLQPSDSIIILPHRFLIEGTVRIYSDSVEISNANYDIDHRNGVIRFKKFFLDDIFYGYDPEKTSVIVVYKNLPLDIPDVYSKFEIRELPDTLSGDTVKVAESRNYFTEDFFSGTELQKSGTIFRGFTVGNNRDLSLQSGFRLQLSGKLSDDIDITAALTDENTPIQPEGTTQKLQELNKVFIELRSTNASATLGDIELNYNYGEFYNFSRKLQGVSGRFSILRSDFFLSGALSRGRFASNSFNGSDGLQGPYRLTGNDNEINIVVLAGSEKVYLDGALMTRGESNDYTIDYSNGSITFTNKRLITNASRITVDFEYSDRKYSRSFIAGGTKTLLAGNKLKLIFGYIREKDDPSKPVDFTLSDSDKTIIANAGDDKFKATKSGVVYAGRDSLGKALGLYIQKDTLINSVSYTVYIYSPGSDSALYNVTFSYVGVGRGDYISLSSFAYKFQGPGAGSYMPVVFLPIPVSYQSSILAADWEISGSSRLYLEGSLSDLDRNLLSERGDTDNRAGALNAVFEFTQDNFKAEGINLGRLRFFLKQRYVNRLYNAVDRLNAVEYDRIWDIGDSLKLTDISSEGGISLTSGNILMGLNAGRIKRGNDFSSLRGSFNLNLTPENDKLPSLRYNVEYISSYDKVTDNKGKWFRQSAYSEYVIRPSYTRAGSYRLFFDFISEDRQRRSASADTITAGSYRFYEFIPGINAEPFINLNFSYKFSYRLDDIGRAGQLLRQSNSTAHFFGIRYSNSDIMSSFTDVSVFRRNYSDFFRNEGLSDLTTVLVSSQTAFRFLGRALSTNLFYKVTSERTSKSEIIFIKVPIGEGNYKYIGDLNGNGLQDENEFILVNFDGDYIRIVRPTDQFFPTTDLQTSVIVNIVPSYLIKSQRSNLELILRNLTFDTYISVSEKSKDPVQENIYFLRFSKFQNDSNTLRGITSVQQDIGIFETNRYFGIKLRYVQRRGMTQYFTGNERFLNIDRTARLRLTLTDDVSLITEYTSSLSRNLAPSVVLRNWRIKSQGYGTEMIYKPLPGIESSFKAEFKRSEDNYPLKPVSADINIQLLRIAYRISEKGSLRFDVSRNEAVISSDILFIPYDLTRGLTAGKSYFWNLNFEYRLSNFVQATVTYSGRAENKSRVIHTGTAELRAFF